MCTLILMQYRTRYGQHQFGGAEVAGFETSGTMQALAQAPIASS